MKKVYSTSIHCDVKKYWTLKSVIYGNSKTMKEAYNEMMDAYVSDFLDKKFNLSYLKKLSKEKKETIEWQEFKRRNHFDEL